MNDQRLYGLIGQLAADSLGRSQELLAATLKTSSLTKAWLYRERRGEVMSLSLLSGLSLVWALDGSTCMLIVTACSCFKLIKAVNKALAAKSAILGYQQLEHERVKDYGTEKADFAPIVRGGSTARTRRDERRNAPGSS